MISTLPTRAAEVTGALSRAVTRCRSLGARAVSRVIGTGEPIVRDLVRPITELLDATRAGAARYRTSGTRRARSGRPSWVEHRAATRVIRREEPRGGVVIVRHAAGVRRRSTTRFTDGTCPTRLEALRAWRRQLEVSGGH